MAAWKPLALTRCNPAAVGLTFDATRQLVMPALSGGTTHFSARLIIQPELQSALDSSSRARPEPSAGASEGAAYKSSASLVSIRHNCSPASLLIVSMTHPFRPPRVPPPPQSARSTETPMDFIYDHHAPHGAALNSCLSSSSSAPSGTAQSHEPPRKRLHHETESMDWESCAVSPPKQQLFPNPDSTRPPGGTFLFHPPSSLPLPPVFRAPSLPSPAQFRPESYGLSAAPRSSDPLDHEADSSMDVERVALLPNPIHPHGHPTKMYSSNAVRHENRRRTRAQRQLRSKLGLLDFHSDQEQEEQDQEQEQHLDSDVEIITSQGKGQAQKNNALSKKQSQQNNRQLERTVNKRRAETTTNNYLTIHGWNAADGERPSRISTDTPYILLVYLQLLFNSSLVLLLLYLAINLICIVRTDINHKFLVHTRRLRQEIDLCTREYTSNRCFPTHQRTQFIEKHCIEWEACMNRDPNLISRSKIAAETFAEIINGFVDMISWKTMLFIILSVGAGIYATNLAMNSYKSKWQPHPPPPQQPQQQQPSTWRPRLFSRSDRMKEVNSSQHACPDPIEIFGQTSKKN